MRLNEPVIKTIDSRNIGQKKIELMKNQIVSML